MSKLNPTPSQIRQREYRRAKKARQRAEKAAWQRERWLKSGCQVGETVNHSWEPWDCGCSWGCDHCSDSEECSKCGDRK